MIIITGKQGQLGNSLILYANFIAFGLANEVAIFNPTFYRYAHYFNFTRKKNKVLSKLVFYILYYITRVLVRLRVKNAVALNWHQSINLDLGEDLDPAKRHYLLQGWNYRGNVNIVNYRDYLLRCFTPADSYVNALQKFFAEHFSNKQKTIVGMHIRMGDYKNFEGGKYFFSLSQYQNVLERLSKLFPEDCLQVLICSNEKFETHQFVNLGPDIIFAPGHELLDMYSLAKCNYIIGPPSTYSMWASFYGNVPLYMLHSVGEVFTLTDFKIQEHF